MKFKDKLQKLRKDASLSQEQLADKLNVSRQAVSKWESGSAYPEMDKIIAISKIFNCGVEYLTNENITESDFLEKGSRTNFNNYINTFLEFITKTTNMFFSMKFRSLIKCLIELSVLGIILLIIGCMISIGTTSIVEGLLGFLPVKVLEIISKISLSCLSLVVTIIGVVVFIHIFKIRYLDYYDIVINSVKEDDGSNNNEQESQNMKPKTGENETNNRQSEGIDNKKDRFRINTSHQKHEYANKKDLKIVIRDSEDRSFKFLYAILRCVVIFIKFMVACFSSIFIFSLFCLVTFLVVLLLLLFDNVVLLGLLIVTVGLVIINYEFLDIVYRFTINKKQCTKRIFIVFIVSLVITSIGTGITIMEAKDYTYTDNVDDIVKLDEEEFEYKIGSDFYFDLYYEDIAYVVDDNMKNNEIKIRVISDKRFNNIKFNNFGDCLELVRKDTTVNLKDIYKITINDIKNRIARNYDSLLDINIFVYGNTSSIDTLKRNMDKKYYNWTARKDELKNEEEIHYSTHKTEVTK